MSVDKFGRYSTSGNNSTKEAHNSIPLTSEGDYNINGKRLRNVKDPGDDNDAINLKTLKTQTSTSLQLEDNAYNAKHRRIANVAEPRYETDSVSKRYLNKQILSSLQLEDNTYNAKHHRIVNVADPQHETDTVTKGYLDSRIPDKQADHFSFYHFAVHDVGDPKSGTDAVNLDYVKNNCLIHNIGVIDGKGNLISNVKEGSAPSDVVVLSQIIEAKNGEWDGKRKVITNIKDGTKPTDAATIDQIPTKVTTSKHVHWDFHGLPLGKIGEGVLYDEAVRMDQWEHRSLRRYVDGDFYDCKGLYLRNLSDPRQMDDAVNVNYIARLLSEMFFDFYHKLSTDPMDKTGYAKKREWIHERIIKRYFITADDATFKSRTTNQWEATK